MKTLALSLLVLVIACCLSPPAAAQPLVFELACPSGYSPLTNMGKTFDVVTGKWRANWCISTSGNGRVICQADGCSGTGIALLLNPSDIQTVTHAAAGGINFQNAACTLLSANATTDAGCAAVFNAFILRSIGSTQNNLRHEINVYWEGDLHQPGASLEYYPAMFTSSALLDSGSNVSGNTRVMALETLAIAQDLASSGVVLPNLVSYKQRIIIGANTHITNATGRVLYLPTVGAGAVVTNFIGDFYDAPAFTGTVTNSAMRMGGAGYQYGDLIGPATVQQAVYDNSTPAKSGICHGLAPLPPTIRDCWFSGNGSPEGAITGNVGAIYSRLDGGAGTSFYFKESGSGNTGWVSRATNFPSQTQALTVCASGCTITATPCTTGAGAFASCDNTVTWPVTFGTAKGYSATCNGVTPVVTHGGAAAGDALLFITAQSATDLTVQFVNIIAEGNGVTFEQINCTGIKP